MLNVMTLNLNGFGPKHGRWEHRRELIAGLISRERPDVVALQAVRRHGRSPSQADELVECTAGYRATFAAGTRLDDGEVVEGSAFLSRIPMLSSQAHLLTKRREDTEDFFRRLVFEGTFAAEGATLRIFNCHFSWVDQEFARNLHEAMTIFERRASLNLVVGDFNAPPERLARSGMEGQGWRDGWLQLHPEVPGHTFESDSPAIRIDYVWSGPELLGCLTGIRLIGDSTGSTRLSDHLGLIATFEPGNAGSTEERHAG